MDLPELNNRLEDQISRLRATYTALHKSKVTMYTRLGRTLHANDGCMISPRTVSGFTQEQTLLDNIRRLQRIVQQVHFKSIELDNIIEEAIG